MGFDGVIGMREVDNELPDGSELAWELDRIIKSGKQFADVFYTNLPEIPPKPAEYDPGVQLSDEKMKQYYGWYFLTYHFAGMPDGDLHYEAGNLAHDFNSWRSVILFDTEATDIDKQVVKALSLNFLVDVASKEAKKAELGAQDQTTRAYWVDWWKRVQEIAQVASLASI